MLDFVILDIEDLYLKSQNMVSIVYNMVGIVYNHEIFQHIWLANMQHLYDYLGSSGWCKLIDISIYKTRKCNSVDSNQTKNDHI